MARLVAQQQNGHQGWSDSFDGCIDLLPPLNHGMAAIEAVMIFMTSIRVLVHDGKVHSMRQENRQPDTSRQLCQPRCLFCWQMLCTLL